MVGREYRQHLLARPSARAHSGKDRRVIRWRVIDPAYTVRVKTLTHSRPTALPPRKAAAAHRGTPADA